MEIDAMTPRRPYLLRAFYEWLVDNDLTPHLVVDATLAGVRVPLEFVQDGQIILNVAPRAVGNLEMGNDTIMFNARFGGRPHSVIVPLYAVQAIYARENGAGTMFEPEDAYLDNTEADEQEQELLSTVDSFSTVEGISSDEGIDVPEQEADAQEDKPVPPKGKPSLRIVK